jgi:myo-inositol-1(or 4)-monophosphatase
VSLDLAALRDVAIRAAAAGAAEVRRQYPRPAALQPQVKGRGDYVSSADRAAEDAVLAVLRDQGAGIPVLAEESGGQRGERFWAVDPLDGTTNFLRGLPVVGVSVGLIVEQTPVAGAVEAPLLGLSWSAARGLGAHDGEGRPVRVGGHPGAGVVATGFPFRRPQDLARYRRVLDAALETFEDLRRAGAATLDLAWSASGVVDGFFELGLGTWDVAGGAALVREAGGVVTDWDGDPRAFLESGDILAGSPAWHERMLELVRATLAP